MKRRTALTVASAALIAVTAFGSAAGALAAKSSATTSTTKANAVAKTAADRPPRDGRGPGGPGGNLVQVVAKLTGETTTTVAAARESGKSFATIASAKNVTASQIVDLALHAPTAALSSEVGDGLITQAEADTRLSELTTHLTAEVADTNVGGPRDGRGHGGPPRDGQRPADANGAQSSSSSSGTAK